LCHDAAAQRRRLDGGRRRARRTARADRAPHHGGLRPVDRQLCAGAATERRAGDARAGAPAGRTLADHRRRQPPQRPAGAVRSSVDLYNPATNTIAAGASMGSARALIDPVALGNDRWLMAGGINQLTLANQGTPTNTAEVYDAAANTWSPAGAMSVARGLHKDWALGGGRFLIAGGANGTLQAPVPYGTPEVYDAAG